MGLKELRQPCRGPVLGLKSRAPQRDCDFKSATPITIIASTTVITHLTSDARSSSLACSAVSFLMLGGTSPFRLPPDSDCMPALLAHSLPLIYLVASYYFDFITNSEQRVTLRRSVRPGGLPEGIAQLYFLFLVPKRRHSAVMSALLRAHSLLSK